VAATTASPHRLCCASSRQRARTRQDQGERQTLRWWHSAQERAWEEVASEEESGVTSAPAACAGSAWRLLELAVPPADAARAAVPPRRPLLSEEAASAVNEVFIQGRQLTV